MRRTKTLNYKRVSLTTIREHLISFKRHFIKYFSEKIEHYNSIKEPFKENLLLHFITKENEQLTDISSDSKTQEITFFSLIFLELSNNIKNEYLEVADGNFGRIDVCAANVLNSKYRRE